MKLAETAFGRFFCFLAVFRARGERWPGLLMLRGYAEIVAPATAHLSPCLVANSSLANLASHGVREGDE